MDSSMDIDLFNRVDTGIKELSDIVMQDIDPVERYREYFEMLPSAKDINYTDIDDIDLLAKKLIDNKMQDGHAFVLKYLAGNLYLRIYRPTFAGYSLDKASMMLRRVYEQDSKYKGDRDLLDFAIKLKKQAAALILDDLDDFPGNVHKEARLITVAYCYDKIGRWKAKAKEFQEAMDYFVKSARIFYDAGKHRISRSRYGEAMNLARKLRQEEYRNELMAEMNERGLE